MSEPKEVKRFRFSGEELEPHDDGNWIEASAYDAMKVERDEYKRALQFYADGKHYGEIDHDVIQVVPGSDEFIDHVIGRTAREVLAKHEGKP